MSYCLFLLVVVTLFLRPGEIIPGWEGVPFYETIIVAALAASAGSVIRQLSWTALARRPVTVCVLGLLGCTVLSGLRRPETGDVAEAAIAVLKLTALFLLTVANLNTAARLQSFLWFLSGLIAVQTGLGVLVYYEAIEFEAFLPYAERQDTGEVLRRFCGIGFFHDPNEMCVLLVVGLILAAYQLGDRRAGPARFLSLVTIAVCAAAIPLTHSRGGMLAVLAGAGGFVIARFGNRAGLVVLAAVLPGLLVAVGGRMTQFRVDDVDDTSQIRLRAWADGFDTVRQFPLLGVGHRGYVDVTGGMVAHNSFVEMFTELGLIGGALFVTAFAYPAWRAYQLRGKLDPKRAPSVHRLRPYMFALLAAQAVGMLSLSRNWAPTTYLFLGLAAAYAALADGTGPRAGSVVGGRFVLRWGGVGAAVFIALYVLTQRLVTW